MAQPLVGHLDPWLLSRLTELSDHLRAAFRTSNDLTFAVSGTGFAGMEAAMVNAIEPGDEVVVGINGAFGERIAEMGARCRASVIRVEAPWGQPIRPESIAQAMREHPSARACAVVSAETSTGVRQPLAEIGALLADTQTLFIVDAVTALGGIELLVDEWHIDICFSATQKCLSVPPGLAPITFSPKAVERLRRRKTPSQSWYFDATMIGRYWGEERVYHHTTPVSMIYGLLEGLRILEEEGLETRWARHAEVGGRLQRELTDRGFELFAAEGFRLPQLTAGLVPESLRGTAARKSLLEDHGIEVGPGFGEYAETIWRVGLMGEGARHENVDRLLKAIDALL
jgi:alanine-glyoxylate transaminase/serine-glyoxylate transaminase/serine-pyruvate transaminase